MRVRPMIPGDIPALRAMWEAQGHGYEFPDLEARNFAAVHVIVDEKDAPQMAVAAKKTIELYLFCGAIQTPAAKYNALQVLHASLSRELGFQGYREVNAFLPPTIARAFGRRLMRSFGWFANWPSYCFRF